MSDLDRMKAGLLGVIGSVVAPTDYHALYAATVVAQNSDLSLELRPDGSHVAPQSKVPIKHGLPGVEVKVAAGARVLLGFEGGDPTKPKAMLWDSGSLLELVITADVKVTLGGTLLAEKTLKAETYRALEAPAMQALGLAVTSIGAALAGGIGTVIALGSTAAGLCATAGPLLTALGPTADAAVLSGKVKNQ